MKIRGQDCFICHRLDSDKNDIFKEWQKTIEIKNIVYSQSICYAIEMGNNTFYADRLLPIEKYCFFLGGADLEMQEIKKILHRYISHDRIFDKKLSWGASCSDYEDEILTCLHQGLTPVLIELTINSKNDFIQSGKIHIIDHHGERAGDNMPTSLEQIIYLLNLTKKSFTRRRQLIAANDRGHIKAMQEIGASREEVIKIRAADRRAQGISLHQEKEAQKDIASRRIIKNLTIIETNSATSSAIADLMEEFLGGPSYENLLVVMKNKFAFYGQGSAINTLKKLGKNCWYGGDLPKWGFWGMEYKKIQRKILIDQITKITNQCKKG